mgnify:CR=1 FL=1
MLRFEVSERFFSSTHIKIVVNLGNKGKSLNLYGKRGSAPAYSIIARFYGGKKYYALSLHFPIAVFTSKDFFVNSASALNYNDFFNLAFLPLDAAFRMLENVPQSHAFRSSTFQPGNMRKFLSCVQKEMALLQTSLPPGIQVRGFEDRMVSVIQYLAALKLSIVLLRKSKTR